MSMKWVSMSDLVTLFLCPQQASQASDLSMKWVSMADLVTFSLCPQFVSDFEHEMSVNG